MNGVVRTIFALFAIFYVTGAAAEIYWLDNRFDANLPHHRTAEEACVTGELKRRTDNRRAAETNPTVRFRFRSINIGPEQGLGERICRGVIERTYASVWVTVETVDTLVFGPQGGSDACNIAGFGDVDTGQCGGPKCTGMCCGDSGGSNGSNPIHTASGNKTQHEVDFVGAGHFPLRFERTYNSNRTGTNDSVPLGVGWSHLYLRRIVAFPITSGGAILRAVLYRPDGSVLKFNRSGSTWSADADVTEKLAWQDSSGIVLGWTVTTPNDELEQYDAEGRLLSITTRDGFIQTLSYIDGTGLPRDHVQSVRDPEGRLLIFGYTAGQLTSVTDGNSQVFTYGYTAGKLTSASYPDESGTPKTRTYLYNESGQTGGANLPYALTGIQDENLQRFASWGYTAAGRANLSVHGPFSGGTIDRTNFVFNANGTTTVTDALGQARIYGFTVNFGVARLASLDQPCDYCGVPPQARTYDANAFPNLSTDFRGFQTDEDFNSRGLQTQRIEAVGQPETRTVGTTWDTAFRVPLTIVELGRTTTLTLNSRGQVLTKTFTDTRSPPPPGGLEAPRVWTYTYCNAVNLTPPDPIGVGEDLAKGCPLVGLIRRVDGPRTDIADRTTHEYRLADDVANPKTFRKGDLWKTTNALGHVREMVSRDGMGRLLRMSDSNAVLTDLSYHPRGWVASRTVLGNADGSPSANDAATLLGYDEVGNLTRLTQADGVFLDYRYDNAHRLDKITDNLGNSIEYTLEALGNRTFEKTFDVANPTTPKRLIARTYTMLSRLDKEFPVDPQALGRFYLSGYDGNGNRTDETDPLGVKTRWSYDGLNRLKTTVGDFTGTAPSTANSTIATVYDARDNQTSITDPSLLVTTYIFDGQNNLDTLGSPDTGGTTFTQDAAGNRLTRADARGITATFTYDALNRMVAISYPTTSQNTAYFYDTPNASTGCANSFPIGRLTRMTDASGSTTWCYDQRGNVTQKVQMATGFRFATGYGYNLADRLMSITYPSGAQLTYTRDADGRIQTLTVTPAGGVATAVLTNVAYLPFGSPTVTSFANAGQSQTRAFDQNYWLTDVTGNALTLHFRRDVMGNIDRIGNTVGATPPTEQYPYDALYRLGQVQDGSGAPIESYTYNLTGDRTTKSLPPAAVQTYAYTPGTHHLESVGGNLRTLDAAGNTTLVTGSATMEFIYDDRNRMTQVKRNSTTVATYAYNGKGERVHKSVTFPSTFTKWSTYNEGGQLLGDYTAGAAREYLWVDDMPIAILDTSGFVLSTVERLFANGFEDQAPVSTNLSYIHTDQLNTPRAVTTTAGTTIWRWSWSTNPFGEAAAIEDPDGNSQLFVMNLRFPGQQYDAETGTHYNYFRDYEPGTGRYLESDPIGMRAGPSTYAYVMQRPSFYSDPSGLGAGNTVICGPDGPEPKVGEDDSGGNCPELNDCLEAHEQCHADFLAKSPHAITFCADPKNSGKKPGVLRTDKRQFELEGTDCEIACLAKVDVSGNCKTRVDRRKKRVEGLQNDCRNQNKCNFD